MRRHASFDGNSGGKKKDPPLTDHTLSLHVPDMIRLTHNNRSRSHHTYFPMARSILSVLLAFCLALCSVQSFSRAPTQRLARRVLATSPFTRLAMSDNKDNSGITITEYEDGDLPDSMAPATDVPVIPENETAEEKYKREKLAEIAERKAQEVFVKRETGRWECQACGYVYSVEKGYAKYDVAPGTPFDMIEKFRCPQCGANKKYFIAETETLSGFKVSACVCACVCLYVCACVCEAWLCVCLPLFWGSPFDRPSVPCGEA